MEIPYYQVNAFTTSRFGGNPAGVCPLEDWLADEQMQAIAAENNLSETAFLVRKGGTYELRWFTPKIEVDLCGHATLASAFVILNYLDESAASVEFTTKGGALTVERDGELLLMDFPAWEVRRTSTPEQLLKALRHEPKEVWCSERDYLAVYESEENIQLLKPNFDQLNNLDRLAVCVTAPGRKSDFVSRFFAPRGGIDEDPVTGSSHCELIPFWSKRLRKKQLHALQLSRRGGEVFCEALGERVRIAGHAVVYLRGVINI
ncbi:MAG TPA: PhzF family phenazine biosynthesis protein [Sedimentisphaerales bacterium]|nr:PhzF family phenazine biosynthesis protein [Sedimentisphaerales bacterium]